VYRVSDPPSHEASKVESPAVNGQRVRAGFRAYERAGECRRLQAVASQS